MIHTHTPADTHKHIPQLRRETAQRSNALNASASQENCFIVNSSKTGIFSRKKGGKLTSGIMLIKCNNNFSFLIFHICAKRIMFYNSQENQFRWFNVLLRKQTKKNRLLLAFEMLVFLSSSFFVAVIANRDIHSFSFIFYDSFSLHRFAPSTIFTTII